jgi:hypothetical protein
MQIKHTFLFTLVLGLVWTGYVFAYILGPDPGVNGIFGPSQTCNSAGCHTGNALNAPGGSVTISGLPSDTGWTPGQTYPLTITIQRPGQRLFGFQLSAVADATNQQAGTLAPGGPRVKIIAAGGVQYAEHSDARVVTSTYAVNWTAPATATVGNVRFNLAGNAANGDSLNSGDFIYTRVDLVGPAAAPIDLSTRPFMIVDRGGVSVVTDGAGDLGVGYSRVQPAVGNTTPSGVAIFGLRQGNALVTEAGVPASPVLTSARIFAEVSGPVNTGLSIVNPQNVPATINFYFTDGAGVDFAGGAFTIEANTKIAKFLDEPPFNVLLGRNPFQGTLSFTSDVGVAVVALRGYFNERSEFLLTTLPVANLSDPTAAGTVYLPHFADGAGWTTQIVLVNPIDQPIFGSIQFFNQGSPGVAAGPAVITANGQTASSFDYFIYGRSSFKLVTSGALPSTLAGSVRVTPTGGPSPSSLVVFSFKPAGITVAEAGVPGAQGGAFRMYAEENAPAGPGSIQTGFAVANIDAIPAAVNLELTRLDGAATGLVAAIEVPANGQQAKFLHEVFPDLPFPFQGILRISGGGAAGLSVVGLRGRYNERGDFLITTTPPSNEAAGVTGAELFFPHVVNGGGYTTQFILFSGSAGQASTGNLRFLKQDGTGLNLTVN